METKRKRLIGISFFLILIAAAAYFWPPKPEVSTPPIVDNDGEPKEEYKNPVSRIVSPSAGSFQNENFWVDVWDIDTGGSGIDGDQCAYSIYDCSKSSCELSFSNAERKCNDEFVIRVGEKSVCSSEGPKACRIVVMARDLAGNSNIISDAEESLKDFGIDWTPPKVEIVDSSPITAQVFDNIELSNCDLFIDGQSQYRAQKYLDFSEIACPSKVKSKCYNVSSDLTLSPDKDHKIKLNCWDLAGNMGLSNTVEIKASINHRPEISVCRALPLGGNLQREFRFEVRASDSDEDMLSYLWDFGDGSSAEEINPSHKYERKGVFEPKVVVSDGKEEVKCSTAWVNVVE